ncbi:hypothetical protein POTOM_050127 [Populus tomentosa]|uniref:Uncharacterized protein n=1 Tax=Populus tomentosa TaxID=118781 RepID=A0A8X8CAG4_POPTO|nr:hypothetical protein POTOM_050127 [Populus tomentosa]
MVVNLHDLVAHLAGIDYRFPLMRFDTQLALVEFAVPVVQASGALLSFLGILFLFIQEYKGYGHFKFERHALNLLIAGPALWCSDPYTTLARYMRELMGMYKSCNRASTSHF